MLISIIIATYNRCNSLKDTIESIFNQVPSSDVNYEVIVVDNNSNDDTKSVVGQYQERFKTKLKYLFEPNQGKSYALNLGILKASGQIIASTDDDCILDKNWINNISNIFKAKNIDLVGGKVMPILPSDLPKWFVNYKENILKYPIMYYDLGNNYLENNNITILPIGANTVFTKSSYNKFGNFTECGRAQDIAFCYKWHKLGAKIAYSPELIVYHKISSARINKNWFRKYFFQAGIDHHGIYSEKYKKGSFFFKVPLWVYKELILAIIRYLNRLIRFSKDYFLDELDIYYNLGLVLKLQGYKSDFATYFVNLR